MAKRDLSKLTTAEVRALLSEVEQKLDAAAQAANWDFDVPEVRALDAERARLAKEMGDRMAAQFEAKHGASIKAEKEKRAKKEAAAKARKKSAAAGRKYNPEPKDLEKVLKEALSMVHMAEEKEGPGKFYEMRLGNRSRVEQQAIRQLADEGYLKKVSKGYTNGMGGAFGRQSELYGGQGYTITPEGEAHLREILKAKGEPYPEAPKPKAAKPKATIKTAPRPEPPKAPPEPVRAKPRVPSSPGASRRLAETRYEEVAKVSRGVVAAVQELWGTMPAERILTALQGETGLAILNAVTAGQLTVAQGAEAFVTSAMLSQGAASSTAGLLVPQQLAGMAADGRSLATLLYTPGITTSRALALGMPADQAAAMGLNQMAQLVATTITDTARTATSVAMTNETKCVSYVRVVKLPACSRCIILASRQYTYSEGFKRHPRCDCGMEPMSDSEWRASNDAKDLYNQMSPEERKKRFGKAAVEAIDNGADISQVVNVRRKGAVATTSTGKKVTTEGTTVRGIGAKALVKNGAQLVKTPGQRLRVVSEARLMPEQILKNAHGDRELQIALLKKHGYIT